MGYFSIHLARWLFILLSASLCISVSAQSTRPGLNQDEVVRVNTQLVQTDVLVMDKHGQLAQDLKSENFELRVNGKLRQVLFFDRFTAGSTSEEARLAAARGIASAGAGNTRSGPIVFDRGRTIFFYIDDYHISANGIIRLRELLTTFVEKEMGPYDEVGIITATGQLGFLEQITNEKTVLRRAIQKLTHRSFQTTDTDRPAMSEAEAIAIMNEDRRILDYFIEQLLRDMGRPRPRQPSGQTNRGGIEATVRARAKSIVDQSAALSGGALSGLEKFIRSTGSLPWQKLAFFVSDGFALAGGRSGYDVRRIADAASRSGTTIFSIDARGLISGSPDASRKMAFDSTGRLASAGTRAVTGPQEVLRTIALDGGGEPILDTNGPIADVKRAIAETAEYYQLSWRPEEEEVREKKFQAVEIKVLGRPDVIVRTRQGFFFESLDVHSAAVDGKGSEGRDKKDKNKDSRPLSVALRNSFPSRAIRTSLSAGYLDNGEPTMLVTATLEVQKESLNLVNTPGDIQLDLAGVVVNENGKSVADFNEDLTVKPAEVLSSSSNRVVYNHQLKIAPGLYQMRVAVEEKKTGRTGSAMQWLEIPNPRTSGLVLSSLFMGEVDAKTLSSGKLNINADHRFPMRSRLGFMTYVYNAQAGPSGPDVAMQVVVMRDGQPVVTKPLVKVQTSGVADLVRIPYGEHFELSDLPAGRYVLQLNAIDRVGKATATQHTGFVVY